MRAGLSLRTALPPALAAAAAIASAAEPGLRILVNPMSQWGWVRERGADSAQKARLAKRDADLAYYRSLGYTHATYGLDQDVFDHWEMRGGAWAFAPDGRMTGTDSSLDAARKAAAAHGLGLIPQLPVLSHMEAFIRWVDPGLSEFPDTAAFARFCAAKGLKGDRALLNHVAAVAANPAAGQIFAGQLGILKRAWRDDPRGAPGYLVIGHDELGNDSVCFIKAGRSRGAKGTRSELVAAEIAARVAQVDSILGDSVRILLYGDSFLPTDLGERYGMSGKPGTGEGGVLWLLRYRHRLQGRLIIMPWNYLLADGDLHYWSRLRYDKDRQLALLERLGFGFIPAPGEQGSSGAPSAQALAAPFALGQPRRAVRSLAEWVRAARRRPRYLRGFADHVFEPYGLCTADSLCAGFTAPLLAYAAWGMPEPAPGKLFRLTAGDLEKIDYKRSRREGKWIPGVHFPRRVPGAQTPSPR